MQGRFPLQPLSEMKAEVGEWEEDGEPLGCLLPGVAWRGGALSPRGSPRGDGRRESAGVLGLGGGAGAEPLNREALT